MIKKDFGYIPLNIANGIREFSIANPGKLAIIDEKEVFHIENLILDQVRSPTTLFPKVLKREIGLQ